MIKIRKAMERGYANHGWLKSYHSFSFADYYDPQFMGFKSLRVINEDFVEPSEGFPTHSHRDMEIITYVVQGALQHKDSMGNGSIIHPGEVQYMSAGTGVSHSEFNASDSENVHLLQIWIIPSDLGAKARYDQKTFGKDKKQDQLRLIASPDGEGESIAIRQDAKIFASILGKGKTLSHGLQKGRSAWVQLVSGKLDVNGNILDTGDAAAISEVATIEFKPLSNEAEFLLFDLI